MDKLSIIKGNIQSAINLKTELMANENIMSEVVKVTDLIIKQFRNGNKLLFCGNGGSAADAQHLAAEFSGRYYYDRPALFSEALHVNTSYLTAVANDYSYQQVYSRLLSAMGNKDDLLIGLSTSGNSENVVNALLKAKEMGVITIGFTGQGGGKMKDCCDYLIEIPSKDTPRIQECHMLIGHTICEMVEQDLFPKS